MCRLAYIPFSPEKEDRPLIGTLFEFLERSFGGNGNGVGFFEDQKPILLKGVKMKTSSLAKTLCENGRSAIFHTRMASMGSICDENCHPFLYNGVMTAHNGHWSSAMEMAHMLIFSGKFSASHLHDMTDSEVIACLVGNYGFGSASMSSGVVLSEYQTHAKVFVDGDFEVIRTPDGRYLYASDFPKRIIDEYSIDFHKKFDRGSLAKLTGDGPILQKGKLTDTVGTTWPTYKRGHYGGYDYSGMHQNYGHEWDMDDERFPTGASTGATWHPTEREGKFDFAPFPGKKTHKKGKISDQVLRRVCAYIGFEPKPDLQKLHDSQEHEEVVYLLIDLIDDIKAILAYRGCYDNWTRAEINNAVEVWLQANQDVFDDYDLLKAELQTAFIHPSHGDRYVDAAANVWVNYEGKWKLEQDLTPLEKRELENILPD